MTEDPVASRDELVCQATGVRAVLGTDLIQRLWSGYGELLRCHLDDGRTVILKDVDLTGKGSHPRGWNTDAGHLRKLRSYEVESLWYRNFAAQCNDACRVPKCLAAVGSDDRVSLVLEDLDEAGFPDRVTDAGLEEAKVGLRWLAAFHAIFLDVPPEGLWPVGTYWHLATRQEEWQRLPKGTLKSSAKAIDDALCKARFQTIVHGDAKLANFCFSRDHRSIAAVDFQYVGGGCGMKDVAYFIGSVFNEDECERWEEDLLAVYFQALHQHLSASVDAKALENEWRQLFPLAWTDFHRFLLGWSPGHWKLHRYSESMTQQTLETINTPPA